MTSHEQNLDKKSKFPNHSELLLEYCRILFGYLKKNDAQHSPLSLRRPPTAQQVVGAAGRHGAADRRPVCVLGWILVDCGDVVVNIMKQDQRDLYDLEGLWGQNSLLRTSTNDN